MKELIIKTQKDLDSIKNDFDGYVYLEGGTIEKPLILTRKFEYAIVISRGNAVLDMWDNSVVRNMQGNSVVQDMWGNSVVQDMWGNSVVQRMWGNSVVQDMRGNSVAENLYGEAMVSAYGMNKITCHGYNIVRTSNSNKENLTLIINKK